MRLWDSSFISSHHKGKSISLLLASRCSKMNNEFNIQGFYKTPVCKALMVIIAIPSLILNFTQKFLPYFVYSFDDLKNPYKVWKILSCKCVFLETTDLVCGLILLYYFRIFERRAGSRKFSSYILAMFILCTFSEILCLIMFKCWEFEKITWQPGFHSILMSFFVKFYMDIPRTEDFPFSKMITYFMGLQIACFQPMNAIFSLIGILMGILYRFNVMNVQHWFNIPPSLSAYVSRTIGPLLRTRPPQRLLQPMGATREIQRQQRLELLEQQMLLAQAQGLLNRQATPFRRQNAIRRRNTRSEDDVQADAERNRVEGAQGREQSQPAEDKVVQLTDMGFSRSEVLHALSVTNNDVSMATNLLVQE